MDWRIRKIIAVEIKSFYKTSNPQSPTEEEKLEEQPTSDLTSINMALVNSFEELLKDEEGFVKSEAIRSFSEIIAYSIPSDQLRAVFVPILQDLYEEKHEECLQELAYCIGRVFFHLEQKGVLETGSEFYFILKDFVAEMLLTDDYEVRKNMMHNLPFLYTSQLRN